MTMPLVSEPAPTSDTATLDDVIAGTDTPKVETPVTPVEPETPAAPEPTTPEAETPEPAAPEGETPEPEPVTLQEVAIPHFRSDQPPLTLAGVPQEAADAIRHLANTAAKADTLSQRVEQLSESNAEDRATLSLLKENPLESMFLLHQQNPTVGQSFAAEWIQMNPQAAVQLFNDLGLGELTEREAKLMADNARFRAKEAVDTGRKGFETQAVREKAIQRIMVATDEVATTLNLQPGKRRDLFERMAEQELATLTRSKNGQVSKDEMIVALQDLASQFQAIAAPPAKGKVLTVQPRDNSGRFAETQQRVQSARALAGGAPAMPALSGWAEPKDTETLDDIMNPKR